MKYKIRKSIICMVFILSVFFMMQISAQAAVIDIADQKAVDKSSVIAGNYDINPTALSSYVNLPSYYSSRESGYTTAVRSQIGYTCWAYSAMASLETLILKDGNRALLESADENLHLSPMHLDYFATPKNSKGWLREYNSSGYSLIPPGYLTSWSGAKAEQDFPETTQYEASAALAAKAKTIAGANRIMYLDGSDHNTIKTAIYEYGSVVGSYCEYFGFYNSSTYSYYWDADTPIVEGLDNSDLGHAVCIVGWDDDYSRTKFKEGKQPKENGAWLCKNSWGATSRDHGYFWISYEDAHLFDKIFGYCYALMDYQQPDENTKLYQNEIYGATYEFAYLKDVDDLTYINVFDFSDNYTILDKINFESTSQGSEYSVYYIPLDSSSVPNSDQSTWTKLYSGEVEYSGYISVDIDDFTVSNGKGAIGIKFLDDDPSTGNSIGICEWLSDSSGENVFIPDTEKGDSYIVGFESKPLDLLDLYSKYLKDDIGGTFVIKAVTKKKEIIKGDVDGDGELTILDATCIQRYLAKLDIIDDEDRLKAADFDEDGIVTICDVTKIQRRLAKLD